MITEHPVVGFSLVGTAIRRAPYKRKICWQKTRVKQSAKYKSIVCLFPNFLKFGRNLWETWKEKHENEGSD